MFISGVEEVWHTRLHISRHKDDSTWNNGLNWSRRDRASDRKNCNIEEILSVQSRVFLDHWVAVPHYRCVSTESPTSAPSLLLKLAQVSWGHIGDGFKLIITSIHYRSSWIYFWVHFLITWLCIENYSLMFPTCNNLHKSLITLSVSW